MADNNLFKMANDVQNTTKLLSVLTVFSYSHGNSLQCKLPFHIFLKFMLKSHLHALSSIFLSSLSTQQVTLPSPNHALAFARNAVAASLPLFSHVFVAVMS